MDDFDLRSLANAMTEIDGVFGVLLGGSRARDAHTEDSDYDLGIYYRPPFDVDGLSAISRCQVLLESVDTENDTSIDAYEAARQAALGAVSDLCLQREIVGLSDQTWVHQLYRVPPSLRQRNTS